MKISRIVIASSFAVGIAVGVLFCHTWFGSLIPSTVAQESDGGAPLVSPIEPREREYYTPNTESLALGRDAGDRLRHRHADHPRCPGCGLFPGRARQRRQVHFRHRLRIGRTHLVPADPYDFLDKVFVGHLHADHFGSLGELFIGGALMGRQKPLRVWGPNGPTPELGTAYAVQKLKEMYTWDLSGRVGIVDFRGYSIRGQRIRLQGRERRHLRR